MKQILYFNEEYLDLNVAKTLTDNSDSYEKQFLEYVTKRAAELLGVAEKEASDIICDEFNNDISFNNTHAAICYDGGSYMEYINLIDVPA